MANIGIIGSGNVGANTAFFIAEHNVAHVVLYDIQEGLSTGKALDMMEAAPVRGYDVRIQGTDRLEHVLANDIIIVTAGSVRKPGMQREDLYSENAGVIRELAKSISGSTAKVIMVSEPVDLLTALFVEESGLDRRQVMGLGGVLDSTRLRYFIAHELGVTTENVQATVIGRHANAMIPLSRYCTVSGVPVAQLMPSDRLEELFEKTRNAGNLIVDMAQRASSYYGPSAAATELAQAVNMNTGRIMTVSMMLRGEYGIEGVAMSLPAVIGRNGIEQVMLPQLTDAEQQQLTASGEDLKKMMKSAGGMK
ncbi:MAG: malate dehydrogenase [Spirochaetes bacterium]|jgi:malate dehydrogenase|nr:malate dehydrogenase [Spirochaetota bacterium]